MVVVAHGLERALVGWRLVWLGLLCVAIFLFSAVAPTARAAETCTGGSLILSAHPDDDLIFMSPDLLHDVRGGGCVRTVYVTAGDAALGSAYWASREKGVEAAYATMAGVPNAWSSTTRQENGRTINSRVLQGTTRIELTFLRLPDGFDGRGSAVTGGVSIQELLTGSAMSITTVDGANSYSLDALVGTMRSFITSQRPTAIRTHANTGIIAPYDDHFATAALVQRAALAENTIDRMIGYRGYEVTEVPENVTGTDLADKRDALVAYGAHDIELCPGVCPNPGAEQWIRRQVGSKYADEAPVERWWNATARDWLDVADHIAQPSPSQLRHAGMEAGRTVPFYARDCCTSR